MAQKCVFNVRSSFVSCLSSQTLLMSSALAVCRTFVLKASPNKRKTLLSYFSGVEQEVIGRASPLFQDLSLVTPPYKGCFERIHYSWFSPYLRSLAERDIQLCVSACTPAQQEGLTQILLCSSALHLLTPLGIDFLRRVLFDKLVERHLDLLPIACLPESPLNALLEMPLEQLHLFPSLLGMHDLAISMKHVIETTKLRQIHLALRPQEQNYLKKVMHQREESFFKKINLSTWDGNPTALRALLEQRGLNRLAKALVNAHASLRWYVFHFFDVEQGGLLSKLGVSVDDPRAIEGLQKQVNSMIALMTKGLS